MVEKIFGTDGVRGKANYYPMTVEIALAMGRAAGVLFRKNEGGSKPRVVIGKDTRLSCYMFENALISGLCSMGVDTLMVGPFPTPGIAFITRAYRAVAGVVISASHNPFFDNGIKFFSSEGFKLDDAWEKEMERLVSEGNFSEYLPADNALGRNYKIDDANGRYIEFAKATFPKNLTLRGMKIALDSANGACYKIAPLVFRELDAEVFTFGSAPNGLNINDGCGSLHLETLQKGVIEKGAHVGIALDGDGDRVIMVDERGQIVDGDLILAIAATDLMRHGSLQNGAVVGTVMTNLGIVRSLEERGIHFYGSKVGDRHVLQEMMDKGAVLGGEQSGHFIFLDHNTTGDGLVAALQVLKVMIETGSTLSALAAPYKRYPQTMINVAVRQKPPLESLKEAMAAKMDAEKELGSNGRVILRYSGTEDLCRVMVEGPKEEMTEFFAKKIAGAIKKAVGV